MVTLSIIIPIYNVEHYVGQCLSSIFDSELSHNVEVILINDGSQDRSIDIVKPFALSHDNVTLIEQNNQGLSSARTAGLSIATGEWIWFVDSDDYLLSGALDSALSFLEGEKGADLFMFPLLWRYGNEANDTIDYRVDESFRQRGKDILKNKTTPIWAVPRYIIRKHLFSSRDLVFPHNLVHEDEYFVRVLLYLSKSVVVRDTPLYVYRQREGSIMRMEGAKSAQNLVEIYKLLSDFAEKVEPEDEKWFRKEVVSLLLESYTRNVHLFGTASFDCFIDQYSSFILSSFHKYRHLFPVKERFLGEMLIRCPHLYSKIIPTIGLAKRAIGAHLGALRS